jgi:pimeloyl-ACP methyl ester carboxylesterase
MPHVTSADGTRIAFTRQGRGDALILVDGALCYRGMGPSGALAARLSTSFTVLTYDRRGRGESGDAPRYAVQREVEDLQALIADVGGEASLFGVSSGAALVLETANQTAGVKKIAIYEAPFIVDTTHGALDDCWRHIDAAVASGQSSEAVKLFLQSVGVPSLMLGVMRLLPVWKRLTAAGRTLPYDGALVKDNQRGKPLPIGRWKSVRMPALVMDGGKSPEWMRNATRALAGVLPNATYRTLGGQTHIVKASAHVPVVTEFFAA